MLTILFFFVCLGDTSSGGADQSIKDAEGGFGDDFDDFDPIVEEEGEEEVWLCFLL